MVKEKVENETKGQKFKRIASKRANRILEDIRLLGNCSNKAVYSFDDKQISQMFSAIEKELKETRNLFNKNKKRKISL
tara:strand:+ start:1129 stop:1362 length:234 start_codon:yes stop_codon:yes gene_type:complete